MDRKIFLDKNFSNPVLPSSDFLFEGGSWAPLGTPLDTAVGHHSSLTKCRCLEDQSSETMFLLTGQVTGDRYYFQSLTTLNLWLNYMKDEVAKYLANALNSNQVRCELIVSTTDVSLSLIADTHNTEIQHTWHWC
jgi:hypothetical protein